MRREHNPFTSVHSGFCHSILYSQHRATVFLFWRREVERSVPGVVLVFLLGKTRSIEDQVRRQLFHTCLYYERSIITRYQSPLPLSLSAKLARPRCTLGQIGHSFTHSAGKKTGSTIIKYLYNGVKYA